LNDPFRRIGAGGKLGKDQGCREEQGMNQDGNSNHDPTLLLSVEPLPLEENLIDSEKKDHETSAT